MSNKNRGNKPNPLLAAFEAKLRKEFAEEMAAFAVEKDIEFREGLARNTEIDLISLLISGNDLGIIGQKRSGSLLEDFFDVKVKLCKDVLTDADDDPDLGHTKATLAKRLKSIMGRENWEKHHEQFPLLRDYWAWE